MISGAPELTGVHRFTHEWEREASLALRAGDPTVVETYLAHGRLHEGTRASTLDQAYRSWLDDQRNGLQALLIAADAATVTELNTRAHADLVAIGSVQPTGVRLADGTTAGVGDRIVTRRNDRTITARRRWAKNGDQWIVTRRHRDGSLTVQGDDDKERVRLPAEYVREHVELGYATTAHRAQGRTVDTAHALVSSSAMTRESLYVAMTPGRHSNTAYIATDHDPDPDTRHGRIDPLAREIL